VALGLEGTALFLVREITKIYEEVLRGNTTELIEKLEKNPIKGEIVLLIEPQEKEQRGGNKYVNDTD